VKFRGSAHSKDLRLFEIGADGITIAERVGDYEGLLTGSPRVVAPERRRRRRRAQSRRPRS